MSLAARTIGLPGVLLWVLLVLELWFEAKVDPR